MPMLAVVVAAAASVVAAAAFTGADSVAVAAIVVGRVRHIPSQAARVVPAIPLPVVPVVRVTRSRAGGIIADTAGRQWEPQRLVPRPMALMALTTTATMRTAIGSVPISINIDTRPANADGGWTGPYRRPFLRYIPLARRAGHAAN